jgi:hypothetical protein
MRVASFLLCVFAFLVQISGGRLVRLPETVSGVFPNLKRLSLLRREPPNYDRMPNLRSHPPRESPEQTAAKPSLCPDTITLQASESFNFAASLVCGGRTVHPVSRVFRSAFTSGNRPHASSGPSAQEEYYFRAGQIAQRKWDRASELCEPSVQLKPKEIQFHLNLREVYASAGCARKLWMDQALKYRRRYMIKGLKQRQQSSRVSKLHSNVQQDWSMGAYPTGGAFFVPGIPLRQNNS